ncbi:MAG: FliM/FliN family flagellar motor switch protein [Puniceicoccales bacterium]|jgi:flagellar motor switch/type III secretory pathway protein FliN|nr:FliM/FliN family flagellar motor switch protein [Puniceicoccales bacterium]
MAIDPDQEEEEKGLAESEEGVSLGDEEEKDDWADENEEDPDVEETAEEKLEEEGPEVTLGEEDGAVEAVERQPEEKSRDPATDSDGPEEDENYPEPEPKKSQEVKADPVLEQNDSVEKEEDGSNGKKSDGDGVNKKEEEPQQKEPVKEEEKEESEVWPVHEKALATAKEVAYAASVPRPRDGFDVGAIEVTLSFDLGTLRLSLRDLESMKEGYSFLLDRPNDEFVTIRANGQPVGRGRIVSIDGRIGVQVEELNGR